MPNFLELPRDEHVCVVGEVLTRVEEPEDEAAPAWADELERRSREISEGRVRTIDWETARTQILSELEQRRANPDSP